VGLGDAAAVAAALDVVWATTRALSARPGATGLVHGDLHQENYLFDGGAVRAIDFDDCGWGFLLHDVAVTLSELEGRPGYAELRAALLEAHAAHGPLADDAGDHLAAFAVLRRVQLLVWVRESRAHPAFRERWRPWARELLDGLAAAVAAAG
jgi:Ser/Thr protein kinase RdoA (MazF antagonist)